MQSTRLTDDIFAKAPLLSLADEDGTYGMRIAYPIGLRYYEGEQAATAFFNPELHKRSWSFLLPVSLRSLSYRTLLVVELDLPVVWDNTDTIVPTPDAVVQRRIELALTRFGIEYHLKRTPAMVESTRRL